MFVEVAIPRSAPELLSYSVPEELERFARPGVRARVPVRNRARTGLVVRVSDSCALDPAVVRPVTEILDREPLLSATLLELAEFVWTHYRCPPGTALSAMLPAGLLRADAEELRLTARGAACDPAALGTELAAALAELRQAQKLRMTAAMARSGLSAAPFEALVEAGLATLSRRRRDRPPQIEVSALKLADEPLDELLERCQRAPQQRAAVEWLAAQDRPVLQNELCGAVGCSPSVVRAMADKGLVHRFAQAPSRRPRWSLGGSEARFELSADQHAAVTAITAAVDRGGFAPVLLYGITGSGKTEVYLRSLERVLAAGRTGMVLVPEIGLTPAASGAVERRFGSRVAVLHSAQSEGERWHEWQRLANGEADIVIGPRSALFAPLPRLGLIVVDEEHDAAYKQQEAPRYNARDLALVLGQKQEVPVLLCSATPSVEASALAERGLASTLRLDSRVSGGSLPEVELVDLRGEPGEPGEQGRTLFSSRLREAMTETLDAGHQVILLIQRRGWAPIMMCRECGHRIQCPSCSVSLVVHQRSADLRCHYCGHRSRRPSRCSACSGELLAAIGAGTEKVAHHLTRHFPDVSAAILDRDTVRRRSGLEETLGAFAAGKTQVLVGTQMVAKGHHFPRVTLTGVISADALLGLPDFRAGERTFQLLTQVAGRSGRGADPGRVIVQTYYPDHPAVRHAARHDVDSFLAEELAYRRAFAYPPAVRMALVRFESEQLAAAQESAHAAAAAVSPPPAGVRLRGPAPAPLERVRGQWRWQLLISAPNRAQLRELLDRVEALGTPVAVRRVVDVDPLSTL